ncbi:signal peptidase I [Maledivibacter halophilus]|uniref:Signal peptidase I n=1 Tax=Maledivibacter halophilus TaxID=36842 RepID=A0A1T5MFP2_9FIRM|nr:signal peptidase I [Maledivibacter halophilus]SKC87076.1 signal peptidase I [Maledivibacter halophilus]
MAKKIFKYILTSIIFLAIITAFILKPIRIQGNSMYPILKDGDWALINKIAFLFSSPKRKDIIVFRLQRDNRDYIIKRIIGLENETIKIISGSVYINNKMLNESYSSDSSNSNFQSRVIPENNFFVIGDNRKISIDSRYQDIGFINKKQIIGKIIFKW